MFASTQAAMLGLVREGTWYYALGHLRKESPVMHRLPARMGTRARRWILGHCTFTRVHRLLQVRARFRCRQVTHWVGPQVWFKLVLGALVVATAAKGSGAVICFSMGAQLLVNVWLEATLCL
jgi:hypothetical protein